MMIDHGFKVWINSPQNIIHASLCFAMLEHIIVGFIGWYMITLGKGTAQARQYLKNTALIPN